VSRQPDDSFAARTDVGRVRPINEDAFLADPPVYAVADGLGGHQAGEVASEIAIATLRAYAPKTADPSALDRAVRRANRAVIDAAREGRGRTGMGTTMTAVVVQGVELAVSHVGDSRAYLLHDGALERVTDDHSMVADMIRQGTLTEAESRHHPNRSVITRALGSDPDMVPDSFCMTASRGDRLLLASDGLHGMLTDEQIGAVLTGGTPAQAASALVDAANTAGGGDNVTVVVVDIGTAAGRRGGAAAAASTAPATGSATTRRTLLAATAWVLAAILIVGGAAFAARSWAMSQAYLKADGAVVAVYEGVPGTFAGVSFNRKVRVSHVTVDQLPPTVRAELESPSGIAAGSLAAALSALEAIESQAATLAPLAPPALTTATPDATTTP
jgi:protein phosphatase